MLILTYAHTRSPQSLWANRVTTDCRKDAADGEFILSSNLFLYSPSILILSILILIYTALILFDCGALQTIRNLQKILLVTHDNFAQSAEACFNSDVKDNVPSKDDSGTNLRFQWVRSCAEATRAVNRLPPSR